MRARLPAVACKPLDEGLGKPGRVRCCRAEKVRFVLHGGIIGADIWTVDCIFTIDSPCERPIVELHRCLRRCHVEDKNTGTMPVNSNGKEKKI